MAFAHLVLRNLLRARVRSVLTLLGISLGITTIIALGVITAGLKATAGGFVQSGGADFMVAQEGAADLSFSVIEQQRVAEVAAVPGVAAARGALLHITRAGSAAYFPVLGVTAEDLAAASPSLVEGAYFDAAATDSVVLGVLAASDLGVGVGDRLVIDTREFTVVGIITSDVLWEESGAFAPLATVQALANRGAAVSVIHVIVAPGEDIDAVARRVEAAVPGVIAIITADDIGQVDSGYAALDAANIAISGLAILIGGIGVMNTMVMSIFERTREIGVLRAVGWSGGRVIRMIVIEALMLCVGAAVVGTGLGLLAVQGVMRIPAVQGLLLPAYEPEVFLQALGVAVLVALVGAAYPAFRATRLTPMEALRYE